MRSAQPHPTWEQPESLARLDDLFRADPAETGLSPVFTRKYRHWFGPGATAFSRRMARRWRRLDRVVGADTVRSGRVLDAGAGFGMNSLLAALGGASEVVAVDLRRDRIEDLQLLADRARLSGLSAKCVPYQRAMVGDAPFDLILCSYFLSHLDDDDEFLELCRTAIAPGGKLYLSDDNNALSPIRQVTVRSEWWRAELLGNRDNARGFLAMRREEAGRELDQANRPRSLALRRFAREYCAWTSRGMMLEGCRHRARWLLGSATSRPQRPPFPFRDPTNGIAEERLLNPLRLAGKLRSKGFAVNLFPPQPGHTDDRLGRLRAALSAEFELVATRVV
jgi:2-polyprenyl-3-methyl-5-hydroxy-6-metoxy-1,4-benzoquinol methylase